MSTKELREFAWSKGYNSILEMFIEEPVTFISEDGRYWTRVEGWVTRPTPSLMDLPLDCVYRRVCDTWLRWRKGFLKHYLSTPCQFRDFLWYMEKFSSHHALHEMVEDFFGEGFELEHFSRAELIKLWRAARNLRYLRKCEDILDYLGVEEKSRFEDATCNRDAFFAEELDRLIQILQWKVFPARK